MVCMVCVRSYRYPKFIMYLYKVISWCNWRWNPYSINHTIVKLFWYVWTKYFY